MTRLDHYWLSNKDWYKIEGFNRVIKKDAPPEAQESYKRYLKQIEEKSKTGAL